MLISTKLELKSSFVLFIVTGNFLTHLNFFVALASKPGCWVRSTIAMPPNKSEFWIGVNLRYDEVELLAVWSLYEDCYQPNRTQSYKTIFNVDFVEF